MFTTRMKKLPASILVAPLLLGIITPLANAVPARAAKEVRFKGQSGGVATTVAFDPETGTIYVRGDGKGYATHLGSFEVVGDTRIHLFTGIVEGNWTLTAANGDILLATLEGFGVDPTHGEGVFTIVGGTGRFEGATGSYQQSITFAAPGGSADVIGYTEVFEGTISF